MRVYACAKEHGFAPIGVGDLWGDILFWPETNPPYGRTSVHGVYLTPEGEVGYTELEYVRVYAFTGLRHANMPSPPRDPAELAALEEKWKERRALEKRLQERAEMDRERRRQARELADARRRETS
jgi:hypothetical protein